MKYQIMFIFYFILFFNNVFSQDIEVTTGEYKCSTVYDDSSIDAEKNPVWEDERLEGNREAIIREGTRLAFGKLSCIPDEESNFLLFYNFSTGLNIRLSKGIVSFAEEESSSSFYNSNIVFKLLNYDYRVEDGQIDLWSRNFRVDLSVIYRTFPGGYNLQARMTPKIQKTTCDLIDWTKTEGFNPKGVYLPSCRIQGSWHSNYYKQQCISEVLYCNIEIFDLIFKTKKLWIPSEKKWAKTPVEAVVYLILHEIGHIENFLYESSKYNDYKSGGFFDDPQMYPFDDTEAAAWDFASTVLHFTCD